MFQFYSALLLLFSQYSSSKFPSFYPLTNSDPTPQSPSDVAYVKVCWKDINQVIFTDCIKSQNWEIFRANRFQFFKKYRSYFSRGLRVYKPLSSATFVSSINPKGVSWCLTTSHEHTPSETICIVPHVAGLVEPSLVRGRTAKGILLGASPRIIFLPSCCCCWLKGVLCNGLMSIKSTQGMRAINSKDTFFEIIGIK